MYIDDPHGGPLDAISTVGQKQLFREQMNSRMRQLDTTASQAAVQQHVVHYAQQICTQNEPGPIGICGYLLLSKDVAIDPRRVPSVPEVDIKPAMEVIITQTRAQVIIPHLHFFPGSKRPYMRFHLVTDPADLTSAQMNSRPTRNENYTNGTSLMLKNNSVHTLLLPVVAWSQANGHIHFLGNGEGGYDKTIRYCREAFGVKAVGVALNEQKVDRVPLERFDTHLDGIITQDGFTEAKIDS